MGSKRNRRSEWRSEVQDTGDWPMEDGGQSPAVVYASFFISDVARRMVNAAILFPNVDTIHSGHNYHSDSHSVPRGYQCPSRRHFKAQPFSRYRLVHWSEPMPCSTD